MRSSRPRKSRTDLIRVSGKNLGTLAQPDCCLPCYWYKLKLRFSLPWSFFPGIFSTFDVHTKNVVHGWIDRHRSAPPWLAELGDIIGYVEPPHYSKFNIVDERHGVLLTGAPDAVFLLADRSYLIADYKTAKY